MIRLSCSEYVRRHVTAQLNSTRGLIMSNLASRVDQRGDEQGRTRTTQAHIAGDIGKRRETVVRAMVWLFDERSGPLLAKPGPRTYQVRGYAEHDPTRCGNVECQADVSSAQQDLNAKKREQARERARRYRERKAAKAAQDA